MSQELTLSLFADLRSPDVAIRFSVLSRLENISWNDELSKAFAIMAQRNFSCSLALSLTLPTSEISKTTPKLRGWYFCQPQTVSSVLTCFATSAAPP